MRRGQAGTITVGWGRDQVPPDTRDRPQQARSATAPGGLSRETLALRAIRRSARELAHTDRVREATADMLDRWGEVLDRLGHA
jgi:hypothetical protein